MPSTITVAELLVPAVSANAGFVTTVLLLSVAPVSALTGIKAGGVVFAFNMGSTGSRGNPESGSLFSTKQNFIITCKFHLHPH